MKPVLLLAGVVALGFSGPGLTKPGIGHGNGHVFAFDGQSHGHADVHAFGPTGYGAGGCPPGLAKKAVPCMPPGQAKNSASAARCRWGTTSLPTALSRARSGRDTASA